MESSRRLRVLFFFAAFLLCLSVCFVYAQDTTQATTLNTIPATPSGLSRPALWVSPTHSAFLAPQAQPWELATLTASGHLAPIASQALLSQVETVSHTHHHLLRLGRSHSRRASLGRPSQDSAILELLLQNRNSAQAQ